MKAIPLIFSMSLVFLAACGGGGGESDTPDVSNNLETETEVEVETVTVTVSDLAASSEFEFTTSKQIDFEFYAPAYSNKRAFISVFTGYHQLDNQYIVPDYDKRVFIGKLKHGALVNSATLTNDISEVLVQIATDTAGEPPVLEIVELNGNNRVVWTY